MKQEKMKELDRIINNDYSNITGIIVQQNGTKFYENYFNDYTANNAIHVSSVTKSVFSILIGIAIDKGLIKSVDCKVLEFFPDYTVQLGEKTIQHITIKHLLTMTAPYKYETEPYEKFFTSENPVLDALDLLGGDKPIGSFNYSAIGGTHILSGILTRATGQSVRNFANQQLFSPLGIHAIHNVVLRSEEDYMTKMNDKNTRGWVVDPQGFNTASWGLFLSPSDMIKLGQLYLNGGMWHGKQIVSTMWITTSTTEHSRCVQWGNLAYGYLWWLIDDKEHSYAALGDGGNAIYINPTKKIVVSITCLFPPEAKDSIELIKMSIEPMVEKLV